MNKAYNPQQFEDEISRAWEESGFFNPDTLPDDRRESFCVVMPPPNVTGVLHLGHALENAIMDCEVRFQRMQGKRVLLVPGTDHAALPTQAKVEKMLQQQGMRNPRQELGREELVRRIRAFAEESKSTIVSQIRKMGTSCDWSRLAYTFDEPRSRAVFALFKRMFNDGLVYRGYRIVHWSVKGQSTCSDDEVVHVERAAKLYTFRYSSDFPIPIASTRPETKLGDTAVAVHPDDERYKQYIGQTFTVEVGADTPRTITVIAEESVDPAFGTGALGVTPAHAMIDYELYERHPEIGMIPVIGKDGHMLPAAGSAYEGLTVDEAREKFARWLREQGLMMQEEEMTQNVGTSDRFGDVIEAIPMEQWFVAVNKEIPGRGGKTLKQLMREAVTIGHNGDATQKINITPVRFQKVYLHWVDNLRDWCISRQIWWGHRIPVWYRSWQGVDVQSLYRMGFHERTVAQIAAGKTKTYRLRDHDLAGGDRFAFENSQTQSVFGYGTILDVRQTTVGALSLNDPAHGATYHTRAELIEAFKFHHPEMQIDEQTPVWVYEYHVVPVEQEREMVVSETPPEGEGWTQDEDTLDTWFSSQTWTYSTLGWPEQTTDFTAFHPIAWIQMGYEIIYLWMARMILSSTYALDQIPFRDLYIHGILRDKEGRKFSKSLGNGVDPLDVIAQYGTDALRLSLIKGITPGNDARFSEAKVEDARNFVNKLWNVARFVLMQEATASPTEPTLADQWIQTRMHQTIAQVTGYLTSYDFSKAAEVIYQFLWNDFADWYIEIGKFQPNPLLAREVLETIVKLAHPLLPFVTEVIWKEMGHADLLLIASWPHADRKKQYPDSLKQFADVQDIVTQLRDLRARYNISYQKPIRLCAIRIADEGREMIERLARAQIESAVPAGQQGTKRVMNTSYEFALELSALIDVDAEKKKLHAEIAQLEKQIAGFEKKLTNKKYVDGAPAEVVEETRAKLTAAKQMLAVQHQESFERS